MKVISIPAVSVASFSPLTAIRRMVRITILIFVFVPVLDAFVEAQEAPRPCTYDVCALRVETRWSGTQIVRGVEGVPVGRIGFFGARTLSALVQDSESALEHARIYERDAPSAAWLGLAGGLLVAVPLVFEDELGTGVAIGASVTGVGLSLIATRLQIRSQRAFSRALWWYNRELPR